MKGKTRAEATYTHVLKYMGVFGGVEGLKNCIKFVKTKLATMYLGTVGNGIADKYANIAEVIYSATNLGMGFSSVRGISEVYDTEVDDTLRQQVCTVRTICLWTAIVGGLICGCGAPYISKLVFGDSNHTLNVLFLSLLVISLPIEAGECAVLKGMRRLKRVAAVETISAIATLFTTIPLYIFLGIQGVLYALVLTQLTVMTVHLLFSTNLVAYRVKLFSREVLLRGSALVRVGLPYAIAAVAQTSIAGAIIHYIGDDSAVGMYGKGILLLTLYSSLAFTAMDVDFFPRLSAVNQYKEEVNKLVNQQLEVCSMLLAPMLLALLVVLPYLVPLLFTSEFIGIVPMCTLAVLYIYFRGMVYPVEYIPLAKGKTIVYLIVEVGFYALSYVLFRIFYHNMQLEGIGISMSLTLLVEMMCVYVLYHHLFGFVPERKIMLRFLMQLTFLGLAVCICRFASQLIVFATVVPLTVLSGYITFRSLGSKVAILNRIKHKMTHSNGDCDCCK